MSTSVRSLFFALTLVSACGGAQQAASPATTAPAVVTSAAAAPPTSRDDTAAIPTTATTATTTPPALASPPTAPTTTPAPKEYDPKLALIAARIPDVDGFSYGEMTPSSYWPLSDEALGVSRSLLRDGSWLGEVSVSYAGEHTADAWAAFVDANHDAVEVLRSQPVPYEDGRLAVLVTSAPSWAKIGSELVLTAVVEPNWVGLWYHDGLVWGVGGFIEAIGYAESLIALQQSTGSLAEPTDVDLSVLEGPLGQLAIEHDGIQYVDYPHEDLLDQVLQFAPCANHATIHTVHPSDDPDPIFRVDEDDLVLTMVMWSDIDGCDGGASLVDTLLAENPGTNASEIAGIPAVIGPDNSWMAFVRNDGVLVEAFGVNRSVPDAYRPLLEAIAAAPFELT